MSPDALKEAIAEAERFLRAAKKAAKGAKPGDAYLDPGAATAAAKRASMDLSKALSSMRRRQ